MVWEKCLAVDLHMLIWYDRILVGEYQFILSILSVLSYLSYPSYLSYSSYLSYLSDLSYLYFLSYLSSLSKLSCLSYLSKLSYLSYLSNLSKLSCLSYLSKLSYLSNLSKLSYLSYLFKLSCLSFIYLSLSIYPNYPFEHAYPIYPHYHNYPIYSIIYLSYLSKLSHLSCLSYVCIFAWFILSYDSVPIPFHDTKDVAPGACETASARANGLIWSKSSESNDVPRCWYDIRNFMPQITKRQTQTHDLIFKLNFHQSPSRRFNFSHAFSGSPQCIQRFWHFFWQTSHVRWCRCIHP